MPRSGRDDGDWPERVRLDSAPIVRGIMVSFLFLVSFAVARHDARSRLARSPSARSSLRVDCASLALRQECRAPAEDTPGLWAEKMPIRLADSAPSRSGKEIRWVRHTELVCHFDRSEERAQWRKHVVSSIPSTRPMNDVFPCVSHFLRPSWSQGWFVRSSAGVPLTSNVVAEIAPGRTRILRNSDSILQRDSPRGDSHLEQTRLQIEDAQHEQH